MHGRRRGKEEEEEEEEEEEAAEEGAMCSGAHTWRFGTEIKIAVGRKGKWG